MSETARYRTLDANEAVARVAYAASEVIAIYPITPASATGEHAGKATRKKDLGLLAMSYGHVYVAEIALQARSAHTVQALLEAERHPGPSLVIAHCPCIAHRYELAQSPAQQKRAIDAGVWPLYRFDPGRVDRGDAPLVLDSRDPRLDVAPTWRTRPASAWSSSAHPSDTPPS